MTKKYVFWTAISVIQLFLLVYISFLFGHNVKFLLASVAYFLEAYILLDQSKNKNERRIMILILLLPPLIIYLPMHLLSFQKARVSFPSAIAHFYGLVLGCLAYYLRQTISKVLVACCFTILTAGFFIKGYDLWMNHINYDSYTGNFDRSISNFTLSDKDGKLINGDNLNGTYTVLYFWDTACGICIQEFPVFQTKLNKYTPFKNIKFMAINVPLKSDAKDHAENMLKDRGYKFPNFYMKNINDVKKFTVTSYPTTIILLDGKKVIYKGDIEGIDRFLQ